MTGSSFRSGRPPAATVTHAVDYWQVLGLSPGADASSLKRAFRAQARRWHPDLNGNDREAEERFKRINEAYAILSDPMRRRAWEAGEEEAPAGPEEVSDPFAAGFPDFDDYLSVVFGTSPDRDPGEQEPGVDEDIAPPHDPEVHRGWDSDAASAPPAAESGVTAAPPSPPPVTAGSDEESLVSLTPEQALNGSRVELELRDGTVVEVWTPPLAGDGWRLRLAGVTPGGGDHFLQLRVRTEEGLRIDGLRVRYQLDLHPADAALGCQVVVPTLEGPVRLRVPPGSSSGRLLRLRGRGLRRDERTGDQLVELRILMPHPLSDAEEALFRRLRELDAEQARQQEEEGGRGNG